MLASLSSELLPTQVLNSSSSRGQIVQGACCEAPMAVDLITTESHIVTE